MMAHEGYILIFVDGSFHTFVDLGSLLVYR